MTSVFDESVLTIRAQHRVLARTAGPRGHEGDMDQKRDPVAPRSASPQHSGKPSVSLWLRFYHRTPGSSPRCERALRGSRKRAVAHQHRLYPSRPSFGILIVTADCIDGDGRMTVPSSSSPIVSAGLSPPRLSSLASREQQAPTRNPSPNIFVAWYSLARRFGARRPRHGTRWFKGSSPFSLSTRRCTRQRSLASITSTSTSWRGHSHTSYAAGCGRTLTV